MDERLTEVTVRVNDPAVRVEAMFDSHFKFFTEYPHFLMAIFATGVLDQSPALDKGIAGLMEVKRRHLLATIKEGQSKGVFTDAFPAELLRHDANGHLPAAHAPLAHERPLVRPDEEGPRW
ncbi:MAG: hypothetical protein IPG74_18045 [Flavobacteriales bacterium]|nr:hypothetical protein [Flavobacteriales bacterium]